MESHLLRLRLGILLILLSWFPFAQICIAVARDHGKLTSDESATIVRLAIWGIQFVVGLVGLWLAGKIVIDEAKRSGLRRTPGRLWQLFAHGYDAR
jgi:hypothetical protein